MESMRDIATRTLENLSPRQGEPSRAENASSCPRCFGSNWEVVKGKGARPCPDCGERLRRLGCLSTPYFALYQDVTLENLQARPDLHWKQPAIVARVKADPERSWAFLGRNRIGKTHIGWALYRYAIEQGRPGVAVPAYQLLQDLTELEINEQARPALTPEMLYRTDSRWCVFIDDLTALPRFSVFGVNQFYQVLNAVIQKGHQLIVTAHASEEQIETAFNQGGQNMGASILGRIQGADRMTIPQGLLEENEK